ncbi:MAG: hypothetical protein BMS9Abin34_492 [Patescibacteria group bacterium]|nr:MAG: hypothetical protein BMS9Abin34_492 [Patescibacteria group bacterium]
MSIEWVYRLIPALMFSILGAGSLGVFYLYKLDRIPRLTVLRAVIFLIVARGLDAGSFLWLTQGVPTQDEINVAYLALVGPVGHVQAVLITQIVFSILLGLALWLVWRWMVVDSKRRARRMILAVIATLTALSIFGFFANVLYEVGLPLAF